MLSLSWRLYRALNIFRRHSITRHPVFQREQWRIPAWRFSFGSWLNWGAGCLLFFGMLVFARVPGENSGMTCLSPLCCLVPLGLLMLFMPLWTLPLSLTLSPVIIHERTRGTWDLLRVTLLDLDVLMMAKVRSALEAIRPLLRYFVLGVIVIGGGIGTIFAVLIMDWRGMFDYYVTPTADRPSDSMILVIGISLGVIGLVLYIVDRVQQLLCMGIAALAAGTSTRHDARGAVLYGIGTAFGVWLAEFVLAVVIVYIGATERSLVTAAIWTMLVAGPMPGYMLMASAPWRLLIALAITFRAREVMLQSLWQWALHAAQQE